MNKLIKILIVVVVTCMMPFVMLFEIWDIITGKTDEDERDDWNQRRDY